MKPFTTRPLAPVSRPRAENGRQVSNPPNPLFGERRSSPSLGHNTARTDLQTARENRPSGLHSSASPYRRAAVKPFTRPIAPVSRPRAKTDRQVSNPPHPLTGERRSSPLLLARSRRSPDRARRMTARSPIFRIPLLQSGGQAFHSVMRPSRPSVSYSHEQTRNINAYNFPRNTSTHRTEKRTV